MEEKLDIPLESIPSIARSARESLLATHPIVTKAYTVITKSIENAYSLARDRIFMRRTGIFMYASPRMGKTYCANALNKIVEGEFPQKYTLYFSCLPSTSGKADIFRDILRANRIHVAERKSLGDIRDQLLVHIASKCNSLGDNHFVLIMDEMQLLRESEYTQLLVLHNWLQIMGIHMTTIGFGQPEIVEQRSALQAVKADQLIARFLSEPIRFRGCGSAADLESILISYDTNLKYPIDSDWSYTNFFLPEAFDSGFRLRTYAEMIWSQMIRVVSEAGRESVPMEYVTRTIEYLLLMNRICDSTNFKLSEEIITVAVRASSLAEFVSIIPGDN